MMKTIVEESRATFKELEQKILAYVCEAAVGMARIIPDEAVRMDKIGLISTNLAEKIASCVTESPYRVTVDIISGTSGQRISHGGVCREKTIDWQRSMK